MLKYTEVKKCRNTQFVRCWLLVRCQCYDHLLGTGRKRMRLLFVRKTREISKRPQLIFGRVTSHKA